MKQWLLSAKQAMPSMVLLYGLLGLTPAWGQEAKEQFIPAFAFEVGAYKAAGIGIGAGFQDYFKLLNERDGGVNGIKITWETCETEYKTDLGIACYEKLKNKGPTGASLITPTSTGMAYALIERASTDKIPLVTMGFGRTDTSDGRVFPYVFPLITNYWSQNTAIIKYIGLRAGGLPRVKGKKIVNLHHGSAFGRETTAILDLQAKKYSFDVIHIEVPHPGTEQDLQWQKIRQINPDWVILRGFGVMNAAALRTANKVGFPTSRIVGEWWSGAEEDVIPAGDAAIGYVTSAFHLTGKDFPVIQDIIKRFYSGGKKKGTLQDISHLGNTYYNRGVVQGIMVSEGIRIAQGRFGKRPLTGEEVRWGLENLAIDNVRIVQLGAFALIQPIKLSCEDHEGGGAVRFQRWDGKEWTPMTGWVQSDQSIVRPLIEKSAAEYAKEANITPRDCAKEAADAKASLAPAA